MKKFMKKNWSTVLLVMMFTVGLSLLLYPTVADWWNQFHATRAIDSYSEAVATMSDEEYEKYLSDARAYNTSLLSEPNRFHPSDALHAEYESVLDVAGDGIMGVVKIPSLRVNLPIYHGVEESTLQDAIGHIEGSSLPIGGESTHTIVSGHRGLPSAKLFTDLDQMEVGDYFMFVVLDDTYTYQVDQIKIVEPNDFTYLQIEEGKDLATLQTCTPYGINTHPPHPSSACARPSCRQFAGRLRKRPVGSGFTEPQRGRHLCRGAPLCGAGHRMDREKYREKESGKKG